jgi:hypothetical protein
MEEPHREAGSSILNPQSSIPRRGQRGSNARDHHASVHRVQEAELHHDEEQKDHDREVGVEEVLPARSEENGSSRDQVTCGVRARVILSREAAKGLVGRGGMDPSSETARDLQRSGEGSPLGGMNREGSQSSRELTAKSQPSQAVGDLVGQ